MGGIVSNLYFALAGCVLVLLGTGHSWLGEKWLLIPLLKRSDLPKLFGDQSYTRRIFRLAWHLTSVAWIAMGAFFIFLSPSNPDSSARIAARGLSFVFLLSIFFSIWAGRGRHLSWLFFLAISVLLWLGAR